MLHPYQSRPVSQKIVRNVPLDTDICSMDADAGTMDPAAGLAHIKGKRRVYDIRVADCDEQRDQAGILIDRMYATRGYLSNGLSKRADDRRITLVASEADAVIGTLTLGFDRAPGLLVDELFGDQTDALRDSGLFLCEFTKLAIDGGMRSRRLIASLFHAAYIFAHLVMKADRLLIEVNPRHVGYYRRMLGFQPIGAPRLNPRVDAPAVLMALDLKHARRQIDTIGGTALAGQADTRSLYPFFFAPGEERDILERAERNIPSHEPSYAPRNAGTGRRAGLRRTVVAVAAPAIPFIPA